MICRPPGSTPTDALLPFTALFRSDHPEAAHLLLALGVWAVVHRHLAVGGAQDGGGRLRLEAVAVHPDAGALDLLVDRAHLGAEALDLDRKSTRLNYSH